MKFRKPELLGHEPINNIAVTGLGAETFDRIVKDFSVVKCQFGQTVYRDPIKIRHLGRLRLEQILPGNKRKIGDSNHSSAWIASRIPEGVELFQIDVLNAGFLL